MCHLSTSVDMYTGCSPFIMMINDGKLLLLLLSREGKKSEKENQRGLTITVIKKNVSKSTPYCRFSCVCVHGIWTRIKCCSQTLLGLCKRMHLSTHCSCVTQQLLNTGQQLLKLLNKCLSFSDPLWMHLLCLLLASPRTWLALFFFFFF